MQLEWDEHFSEIVVAAWQDYLSAETELSAASRTDDDRRFNQATYAALRKGGAATIFLHHFIDLVLRARPPFLPNDVNTIDEVQDWLAPQCTMLRSERVIPDVRLVGDVADALKHCVLTRRVVTRQVAANDQVMVVATGFGELGFGEGKYGGVPQVVVRANDRPRALSSVLQNVIDAWRRAAGLGLPEIGQP